MKPIEIAEIKLYFKEYRTSNWLEFHVQFSEWWYGYFGARFYWGECTVKLLGRGSKLFVHPNGWTIVENVDYKETCVKVYQPGNYNEAN